MRKSFLGVLLLMTGQFVSAAIILSPEAAGVQSTTVAGTITENFNALTPDAPLGAYVSIVGTYSAGAQVVSPDDYGGSNATRYVSVGAQSNNTLQYTLTFGSLQSYFGFYWQAVDDQNRLDFYNGATLIQTFQGSDFVGALSNAYFANPNNGADPTEKFVYLNFTSNAGATNFDSVVFRNLNNNTGFETDNHSILKLVPDTQDGAVPEPTSAGFLALGLGALALARRRRK